MKIKGQRLCYSPVVTVGFKKKKKQFSHTIVFARFYIAIWWKDLGPFALRELRGKHTNFHAYKCTTPLERARNGFQITSLAERDARFFKFKFEEKRGILRNGRYHNKAK